MLLTHKKADLLKGASVVVVVIRPYVIKRKVLRKHSQHGEIAALVLLEQRCHTMMSPII